MFDRCAVGHLPFSKKMYLPLVGNGSPTIFEENVSTTSREWVTYHAKHVSSTGREFKADYSPAKMKQVAYVGLKKR